MKHIKFLSVLLIFLSFALCGCMRHEDRVLSRLNNLAEKVEKNGPKWNAKQWINALDEFEDIHYDMSDCKFSTDQQHEVDRAEGRLTVMFMQEGVKKIGEELGIFIEGPGAFMQGYQEGANEAYDASQEVTEAEEWNLNAELQEIIQEGLQDIINDYKTEGSKN